VAIVSFRTVWVPSASSSVRDLAIAPALHGACDLEHCSGRTVVASGRELVHDVTAGKTYYVVVDGPAATGVEFELSLSCP
jgi:hypothetical protein